MKSLQKGQRFRNRQIVDLAGSFSTEQLKDLALEFLGFNHETVQSILAENNGDQESFKREIFTKWANMNTENQVQVLAGILYHAASVKDYIDPCQVEEILGLTQEEASLPSATSETEIKKLTDGMREFYQRRMKIEMAPWAKGYTVDVKEIYTELSLEKIENQPTGPEGIKIEDYKDLFKRDVQGASYKSAHDLTEKREIFPDSSAGQTTFDNEPIAKSQITEKEVGRCAFTNNDKELESLYERDKCSRSEVRTDANDIITEEVKVGKVNMGNIGKSEDEVKTKITTVRQVAKETGSGARPKMNDKDPRCLESGMSIGHRKESVSESVNDKDTQSRTQPGPSHTTTKESIIGTRPRDGKKKAKAKKILFKGDPGTGKTTFSRKVAWDWATGLFTAVSIIFFVTMKLAKPGETIENVIIQQTPVVQALNIGEKRLRGILEDFGSKCLIILEGLDEHDLQKSPQIADVIIGRQLLGCNVFVTSRPHNISDFEEYFSTVVQVQGFTEYRANTYLTKILSDKAKVPDVLSFNAKNFSLQNGKYASPMLLLFVGILTNSGEIDLSKTIVSLGEIYTRLIRCLYRKFTVRKGIAFKQEEFEAVLASMGRLALKILATNTYHLQRGEVLEDVGEDCFEYGLIIGHEDFRLLSDPTADVVVTFAHSSLQDFVGAFYFTYANDRKIPLPRDHFSPLHRNALLFQFILWLLSDICNKGFFKLSRRHIIYVWIKRELVKALNHSQIHLEELKTSLPSFSIYDAVKSVCTDLLNLALNVFHACDKTKELYWVSDYHPGFIRKIFLETFPNLQIICNLPQYILTEMLSYNDLVSDNDIIVAGTSKRFVNTAAVLKYCDDTETNHSLYLLAENDDEMNLDKFMTKCLSKLRVFGTGKQHPEVLWRHYLPWSMTHLKEMAFVKIKIYEKVPQLLSQFVAAGKLPALTHLHFEKCGDSLKTKLGFLFGTRWANLTNLTVLDCFLHWSDLVTLHKNLNDQPSGNIPRLTSLTLDFLDELDAAYGEALVSIKQKDTYFYKWRRDIDYRFGVLFPGILKNLSSLQLHNVTVEEYTSMWLYLNSRNVPNLTELGITMWEYMQTETRTRFSDDGLHFVVSAACDSPQLINPPLIRDLKSLGLRRFILFPISATSLLPVSKLEKLDISCNATLKGLLHLTLSRVFPVLSTLIVSECGLTSQDLKSIAKAGSEGKLPALKHLDVSQNEDLTNHIDVFFCFDQTWPGLHSLNITQKPVSNKDFRDLMKKVKIGYLSSLEELRVSLTGGRELKTLRVEMPQLRHLYAVCPLGQYFVIMAALTTEDQLFPNLTKITLKEIHSPFPEKHDSFGNRALGMVINFSFPQRFSNDLALNVLKHTDPKTGTVPVEIVEEMFQEIAPGLLKKLKQFVPQTNFHHVLSTLSQMGMESVKSSKPVDGEQFYEVMRKILPMPMSELLADDSLKQMFVKEFTPMFKRVHVARLLHSKKFLVESSVKKRLNTRGARIYVTPPELRDLNTDISLD